MGAVWVLQERFSYAKKLVVCECLTICAWCREYVFAYRTFTQLECCSACSMPFKEANTTGSLVGRRRLSVLLAKSLSRRPSLEGLVEVELLPSIGS